jgi:hypothetical protein
MGLFDFFVRRKSKAHVLISDAEIVSVRSNGHRESVRLDDLSEVVIITTDEGPFTEDVFFVLIGRNEKSGCAVPQSAEGCDKLLELLQKLPGFDNESVIKAMGSTSNGRFLCWKK